MVRQATATAVSASISTPVRSATLAVARTRRPGRASSGSISIVIAESPIGWQSGISSCVRLAAMIPAIRAVPTTSPFLALPLRIMASVAAAMTTAPSATALRSVTGLSATSTMLAAPLSSRWVRDFVTGLPCRPGRGSGRGFGLEKRRGRVADVGLPHQAFPDEIGPDPDAGETGEVGGREDAAFADEDAVLRHQRRQPFADREARLEAAEVAIVDADEAR